MLCNLMFASGALRFPASFAVKSGSCNNFCSMRLGCTVTLYVRRKACGDVGLTGGGLQWAPVVSACLPGLHHPLRMTAPLTPALGPSLTTAVCSLDRAVHQRALHLPCQSRTSYTICEASCSKSMKNFHVATAESSTSCKTTRWGRSPSLNQSDAPSPTGPFLTTLMRIWGRTSPGGCLSLVSARSSWSLACPDRVHLLSFNPIHSYSTPFSLASSNAGPFLRVTSSHLTGNSG